MSCLHPIRTCFSITCPRLGENDGNLHCQEVLMNTDFLEDAVVKAKVFFREVVLPELLTGNIKKGLDAATTCTSHPCMNNDICTEESEVDFPCGKCGLEFVIVSVNSFRGPINPKTTRLTLRMPQSLTSPIIPTSRPLSPGIPRELLMLTIAHALSLINILFFLANNGLHTYHLYCTLFFCTY